MENTEAVDANSPQYIGDYQILKFIGKGKFAFVYRATKINDSEIVALKKITVDVLSDKAKEKCLKEVKLLQSLNHQNIVRYMDSFLTDNELIIVYEWAAAGDLKRQLRKALERGSGFEERVIWKYFSQICNAIQHMHERRIMHRDLKPANIFLTLDGTIKVGDLGLSKELSEHTIQAHTKVGTPLYMSPEVIRGEGYDFKSDIWSLGCLLYELAMLKSPFKSEGLNMYSLFEKIANGEYQSLPDNFSEELRTLVYSMLATRSEDRPDINYVCQVAQQMKASKEKAMKQQRKSLDVSNKNSMNGTMDLTATLNNTSTNPTAVDKKDIKQETQGQDNDNNIGGGVGSTKYNNVADLGDTNGNNNGGTRREVPQREGSFNLVPVEGGTAEEDDNVGVGNNNNDRNDRRNYNNKSYNNYDRKDRRVVASTATTATTNNYSSRVGYGYNKGRNGNNNQDDDDDDDATVRLGEGNNHNNDNHYNKKNYNNYSNNDNNNNINSRQSSDREATYDQKENDNNKDADVDNDAGSNYKKEINSKTNDSKSAVVNKANYTNSSSSISYNNAARLNNGPQFTTTNNINNNNSNNNNDTITYVSGDMNNRIASDTPLPLYNNNNNGSGMLYKQRDNSSAIAYKESNNNIGDIIVGYDDNRYINNNINVINNNNGIKYNYNEANAVKSIERRQNNNNNSNTKKLQPSEKSIKNVDSVATFIKGANEVSNYKVNGKTLSEHLDPCFTSFAVMETLYDKLTVLRFPMEDPFLKKEHASKGRLGRGRLLPIHFACDLQLYPLVAGHDPGYQFCQFRRMVGVAIWLFKHIAASSSSSSSKSMATAKMTIGSIAESIQVEQDAPTMTAKQLLRAVQVTSDILKPPVELSQISPTSLLVGHGINVCNLLSYFADAALTAIEHKNIPLVYPASVLLNGAINSEGISLAATQEDVEDSTKDEDKSIESNNNNNNNNNKGTEDSDDDDRSNGDSDDEDDAAICRSIGYAGGILAASMVQTTIDPVLWRQETERVAARLTAAAALRGTMGSSSSSSGGGGGGYSGWNDHIEQLKDYGKKAGNSNNSTKIIATTTATTTTMQSKNKLPISSSTNATAVTTTTTTVKTPLLQDLTSMRNSIDSMLSKVRQSEIILNRHDSLVLPALHYCTIHKELLIKEKQSESISTATQLLVTQLEELQERCDEIEHAVQLKVDGGGDSGGGHSIVRLKEAIKTIKDDIHSMTVGIAMLNNSISTYRINEQKENRQERMRKQASKHHPTMKQRNSTATISVLSDDDYTLLD